MPSLRPLPPNTDPDEPWTVADLEWIPRSYDLRLVGVLDRDKGYRYYTSVEDYLDSEVTRQSKGSITWLHAFGMADCAFFWGPLSARGHVRVQASGSAAIRVSALGQEWRDSYRVLRSGIGRIGKALGLHKGDVEWDAPLRELIEYNERDNEILLTALEKFRADMRALGGRVGPTIAATALDLFRRAYQTEEIAAPPSLDKEILECFKASRVEVLDYRGPEHWGEIKYHDINSSFPASMRGPIPAVFAGRARKLVGESKLGFAKARVHVPRDLEIPPLAWRHPNTDAIYHPTGTWESVFTQPEIEHAESLGCQFQIREWLTYYPFYDLERFAEDLYERKATAPDPWQREEYKYALNNLYGKFAQRQEQIEYTLPGPSQIKRFRRPAHRQPHVSAWITAKSRVLLHQYMLAAGRVLYVDTDSVVTPSSLPTGKGLGELKLEHPVIQNWGFHAPKLYWIECPRADSEYPEIVVRAKGYPAITKILRDVNKAKTEGERYDKLCEAREAVETLVRGEVVGSWEMARFRRQWRTGGPPHDYWLPKRAYLDRPKRCRLPSGATRPWDVSELN